ncbi:MAG: hypothetical protein AAGK05_15175 [Pseudomonadota bacterium]
MKNTMVKYTQDFIKQTAQLHKNLKRTHTDTLHNYACRCEHQITRTVITYQQSTPTDGQTGILAHAADTRYFTASERRGR